MNLKRQHYQQVQPWQSHFNKNKKLKNLNNRFKKTQINHHKKKKQTYKKNNKKYCLLANNPKNHVKNNQLFQQFHKPSLKWNRNEQKEKKI